MCRAGTRVVHTRVSLELKALWLDFKEQNRVSYTQDVSFLNNLKMLLINEIVQGMVLFSNFSKL